jgi:hypothetical protein
MASWGHAGAGRSSPVYNFYEIFISDAVEQPRIYMRHSRYSNRPRAFSGDAGIGSLGNYDKRGPPMLSFALDFVFVAIGAAAFAVTALYLKACARL